MSTRLGVSRSILHARPANDLGTVARAFERLDQFRNDHATALDAGLVRRQVDRRLLDALDLIQGLLNARDAGGAVHAVNLKGRSGHPLIVGLPIPTAGPGMIPA